MMRRASTSHNGGVEEEKKEPTFFKIIKPGFNTEHLVVSNPGHFLLNRIVSLQIMYVSWSPLVCFGCCTKEIFDCDLGHNHYETTIN